MLETLINITPFSFLEDADGSLGRQAQDILKMLAGKKDLLFQISIDRDKGFSRKSFETVRRMGAATDLKMRISGENLDFAAGVRPYSCTLVNTMARGRCDETLPVAMHMAAAANAVSEIHRWGGKVYIVSSAEDGDIDAVAASGADGIEFCFALPEFLPAREELCYIETMNRAAERAKSKGLQISFSGNIEFVNIPAILRIRHIQRVNVTLTLYTRSLGCGVSGAMDEIFNLLKYYSKQERNQA